MSDYSYGYCGMPCALCPRHRTDGTSRCPGCSANGYYTDVCKVHHCCQNKKIIHCGLCEDFPCARLGKMGDFRDLNTDNVKLRTCNCVAQEGFANWYNDYIRKADLMTTALARYNNGRMKRYICELFIRQDLETLKNIMDKANSIPSDVTDISKAFRLIAEEVIGNK